MIPAEREAYIIEILKSQGVVTVEELAQKLNVTPMTIRRDLSKLESLGIASRSHGGAILNHPLQKEQSYESKKAFNNEQKQKIAALAAQLVKDGDTVLLDAGTTTFELALLLKEKEDITVVTNDLKIAMELYSSNVRLFIAGGQIQPETASVIGAMSESFISGLQVDIAFMGTSAISRNWFLCTPTAEKAALKQKMIHSASHAVLLADSSKFYKESFIKICALSALEYLVTDKIFSKEEIRAIDGSNMKILQTQ